VYGLLDDSWERYSAFCEAYEAAGKDLPTMTAQLQEELSKHLPGSAALRAWQAAEEQAETAERALAALENKLDDAEAANVHQQKMFTDLAALMRGAARLQYNVSRPEDVTRYIKQYLPGCLSEELEAKLLKALAPTFKY
jgi:hypothetical protein